MTGERIDDHAAVRCLLELSGLRPEPSEIEVMAAGYPAARAMAASLYTVTDVRYEQPAMRFDPHGVGDE